MSGSQKENNTRTKFVQKQAKRGNSKKPQSKGGNTKKAESENK